MRERTENIIMENLILKNQRNLGGKYVAKKSFADMEIVGAADTPQAAHESARKMGVEEPVIFYVPQKGMVHIY